MRTFLPLLLCLLPGCTSPDVIVTPGDSGFFGDGGLVPDASVPEDAYVLGLDVAMDDAADARTPADATFGDAGAPTMDRWEVSWGQVFASGGFPVDAGVPMSGPGCTSGLGDSYPVNCISQELAAAYCASQGQRLPTQAEWLEEAARAPEGSEVTGATMPAMVIRSGVTCTTLLCDLRGNVAEWVVAVDGGPGVAMGGDYSDPAPSLRERAVSGPDVHVGFRCRTL